MKTPKLLLTAFAFALFSSLRAQQWGDYTLIATQNGTTAKLIDTSSATFHSWTGLTSQTAYSSYLLPGGVLLRTIKVNNATFTGGGMAGGIQKVDWNGTLLWNYSYSTSSYCSHHDICPMPNGNVLIISYELKTAAQVTQAGCQSSITMWPDKIVEVQQTGATTGTVVWEWHLWDHLCQSYSAAVDNYVSAIGDHAELFNINSSVQREIFHMNGIDYNPVLDQIVVSAHNTNELYVIDHSTTIAEAASHSGGRGGMGGDFLYRWGKPANYGQSAAAVFNVVHDAHWVPENCPNAGNLVGFNNNGISNSTSCIDQATPPYSGYNYTHTPNTAYSPTAYTTRLVCTGGTSNMGNSQQLPNGNTLVCIALSGTVYETNPAGTTIWTYNASGTTPQASRYTACYVSNAAPAIPAITQNVNTLTSSSATTYQWYMDGVLIPGATNQSYTITQNGTYVVRVTDANGCVYSYSTIYDALLITGIDALSDKPVFSVYPNPANETLNLEGDFIASGNFSVKILNAIGEEVLVAENKSQLDVSMLNEGSYFIMITSEKGITSRRIIVIHQ